ncbi:hypothetical protein PPYR_00539 [Photinus pyralis]|uniref:Metalloendopeptidase n=1 Tax=Photinus pyralis TaxID=7054 RepID=A0A5N4B1T8_PHOPY|nr:hypothetical protein PPYR_00539 [Photinus pyralis]
MGSFARFSDGRMAKSVTPFLHHTINPKLILSEVPSQLQYSNDHGCESAVGRWGGQQILNFQSSCFDRGTMLHEMLHAVGFRHQHNSPDRDDYITINRENLKDGSTTVLKKYTSSEVTNFGLPYDYCSVSHYSMFASSKNGKPTIVPKFPTTCELGTATDLSPIDKKKINLMYPCGL